MVLELRGQHQGVERTFSYNEWLKGTSRSDLSDDMASAELRILSELKDGQIAEDDLLSAAQKEWARVYGDTREA